MEKNSPARAARVSVALGTHNGAQYIIEQLASILDQSVPVSQIVVSDDASRDGTVELINSFFTELAERQDVPELLVLQNEPALGVTANFEQAIRACTGDFIALADQDDVWQHRKVERLLLAFEDAPSTMLAFSDARLVDGEGRSLGVQLFQTLRIDQGTRAQIQAHHAYEALLRRNIVTGATVMFRRELADFAAPFPAAWVHDEWLAISAAVYGDLAMLDEPLIDYRQHGGNQIGASTLTTQSALQRLRAPRALRNERLLARAAALAERLPELKLPQSAEQIRLAREKLAHERARSAYPVARIRRAVPIWRRWRTGDYARFGLGVQDVVRDLVQPA